MLLIWKIEPIIGLQLTNFKNTSKATVYNPDVPQLGCLHPLQAYIQRMTFLDVFVEAEILSVSRHCKTNRWLEKKLVQNCPIITAAGCHGNLIYWNPSTTEVRINL